MGESNFIPAVVAGVDIERVQLRGDGVDFVAHGATAVAAGERVTVTVRPEKTLILPAGAPPAARDGRENWVGGAVAEVIYLGESRKYRVRLPDGVTDAASPASKPHRSTCGCCAAESRSR